MTKIVILVCCLVISQVSLYGKSLAIVEDVLEVSIKTDRADYVIGEPINIGYKILNSNPADVAIRVISRRDGGYGRFCPFILIGPDGKKLAPVVRAYNGIFRSSLITLAPKQFWETTMNLAYLFQISDEGVYRVTGIYPAYQENLKNKSIELQLNLTAESADVIDKRVKALLHQFASGPAKDEALWAIASLGKRAVPGLSSVLHDEKERPYLKEMAVVSLCAVGGTEALEEIVKALRYQSTNAQVEAISCLWQIGNLENIPALEQITDTGAIGDEAKRAIRKIKSKYQKKD